MDRRPRSSAPASDRQFRSISQKRGTAKQAAGTFHDSIAQSGGNQLSDACEFPTQFPSPVRPDRQAVNADAIAIFHLQNGKIAEEWVSRGQFGMLLSAAYLHSSRPPQPSSKRVEDRGGRWDRLAILPGTARSTDKGQSWSYSAVGPALNVSRA